MASLQLWSDPQRVLDHGQHLEVLAGRCQPFGASCPPGCDKTGPGSLINFALFSRSARAASLLIFAAESAELVLELKLDPRMNRTGDVWHAELKGLARPVRYAWKLDGRLCVDPWALSMEKCRQGEQAVYHAWYPVPPAGDRSYPARRLPLQDLVIYELHLRGFTRHESSGVSQPGTYKGLIEKIPYLKDLGVGAVELMPVHEYDHEAGIFRNPDTGEKLGNFWGYDPVGLFAPARRYAAGKEHHAAVCEFREMVAAFHQAGIEVLLDVVLNHTGEGSKAGPALHFRVMDERIWYINDEQGNYLDFTGCGNTLNCNHPVVREYVIQCLRSWVTEFGVDGFRFDLASVLGRSRDGHVLPNSPVLEQITLDPVLAGCRLIAEAWDAAGLYQVGHFDAGLPREDSDNRLGGAWAEWNGRYRDDLRRIVRGDAGMSAAAATRLAGSSDLFQWNGRGPAHSLNFITCHDGFTLADLVSYNQKHNRANGEESRDGLNDNLSWNCGVEGPTPDPVVLELRCRQQRNLLAMLFLSQGTPMLLAGDEFGRSQQGNNNAWCQDNELGWVDWSLLEKNSSLHAFTRALIALRQQHDCLRHERFLESHDVSWHQLDGSPASFSQSARTLVMRLKGVGMIGSQPAPDLCLAFNFSDQAAALQLDAFKGSGEWRILIDTRCDTLPELDLDSAGKRTGLLELLPRSLVLLADVTR